MSGFLKKNYLKKVDIIPERVKRVILGVFKTHAFKHNGIIFGGMVRDEIISDHYKKLYYQNQSDRTDINKFWNPEYHPETASRTLNPEDMDVSFSNDADAINFITSILNQMKFSIGNAMSHTLIELINTDTQYYMLPIKSVRRLTFNINLGYIPFVFCGHEIILNIDIVMPQKEDMLPPFKTLDMLCNSFIMTKHGKMLSTCTGTPIDKLTDLERMKVSSKIMLDIVNFETNFCLGSMLGRYFTGSFKYNKYAFKRIQKMLSKRPVWTIKDLPFEITEIKKRDKKSECCICCSRFNKKSRKITFYNKKTDSSSGKEKLICSSELHESCLMKYIEYQIQNREDMFENEGDIDNIDREFVFKCPYRNPINFLQTSKIIKSKIADLCN